MFPPVLSPLTSSFLRCSRQIAPPCFQPKCCDMVYLRCDDLQMCPMMVPLSLACRLAVKRVGRFFLKTSHHSVVTTCINLPYSQLQADCSLVLFQTDSYFFSTATVMLGFAHVQPETLVQTKERVEQCTVSSCPCMQNSMKLRWDSKIPSHCNHQCRESQRRS